MKRTPMFFPRLKNRPVKQDRAEEKNSTAEREMMFPTRKENKAQRECHERK